MYMRKFLFLPLLSLLASCAKDDDCSLRHFMQPSNSIAPTPIPDRWKYFPANPMAVSM